MRRRAGVPTLRVIYGRPSGEHSQSPAARLACRYRASTIRVPAGTLVRHPLCPQCGERLAYLETVGGTLLDVVDPRIRLSLVDDW